MQREGKVIGGAHDGEIVSCEEYGYTPATVKIWWIRESKEKFSYEDGEFRPYDGPVIFGTGYTF